ncbi:MAG: hypothetical protein ACI9N9_000103 [Enterobacterales bacterium]|jgi:hypothetical protein
MAGEINENPVTTVTIDPAGYFDLDNWTGAAFESQRVPISVMQAQIGLNIMNSNLVQAADRNHDSGGFTQSFTNGKQFSMTSGFAPASLGSFEFGGFGTSGTDQLVNIKNGSGTVNTTFFGDKSVKFFGDLGINGNPLVGSAQSTMYANSGAYGHYITGTHAVANYATQSTNTTAHNFFSSKTTRNGFFAEGDVSGTVDRFGFNASFLTTNTADNYGIKLDAVNPGAGNAYAMWIKNGNVKLDPTVGTTWGLTGDKQAWFNSAPVVQQTSAIVAAAFIANTSGIADDTATFGGYTIGQLVAALKVYGFLA